MAERQRTPRLHRVTDNRWGLCAPFMTQLPISGALVSIVGREGHRSTVAATDPVAARWDELELELGCGPLRDATIRSALQSVDDVRTSKVNPVLGSHLEQLGVRALVAIPLRLGSATVGVAGLHWARPGGLTADTMRIAIGLARAVTVPAVRQALRLATQNESEDPADSGPGLRREVHQATGILSVQLDTSITEAFARLRAYSIATGRSITAVSRDIVDGTIGFRDLD